MIYTLAFLNYYKNFLPQWRINEALEMIRLESASKYNPETKITKECDIKMYSVEQKAKELLEKETDKDCLHQDVQT